MNRTTSSEVNMLTMRYGGKRGRVLRLYESDEHIVVRTRSRDAVARETVYGATSLTAKARRILAQFDPAVRFGEAGVEVFRARAARGARSLRDEARKILKQEPNLEFCGRVLVDQKTRQPWIYTENFFVKFEDDASAGACSRLLKRHGLAVKRRLPYARNAYFVGAEEGTGLEVFGIAGKLLAEAAVDLCHPEVVRERRQRRAFDQQWHLKRTIINGTVVDQHASVEAAWSLSQGEGITIAVVDDGVDVDHEEFRSAGKIVAPRDVTRGSNDARPKNSGDRHGHACAGVACADGSFGASGVAPKAKLMPIRLASGLGSQAEADAFVWAADHGADVISCSWGPEDGTFDDPNDPIHQHVEPLPDSTRLALDYAVRHGRNGRGCVICFAAGNGNESVDNDGYASYAKVIAVAACDDTGKKAPYSDFGNAVWCAFPSNHYYPSVTRGIWTTDRPGGTGYNPGNPAAGDAAGNYTNSFGGTSSACPGAAGVAALVLARNPALRSDEVRDVLKRCADRIDPAGGHYDGNGHSALYGYGRLNARRAVELALPAQTSTSQIRSAVRDVPIRDFKRSTLSLPIADTQRLASLKVTVNLEHTYIGDLVITIKPPAALGLASITLHNREGGGIDNLNKTYDPVSTPGLAKCLGKSPAGTWTLAVKDKAAADSGRIRSLTLELGF
jgi:subtilisin family serine protease